MNSNPFEQRIKIVMKPLLYSIVLLMLLLTSQTFASAKNGSHVAVVLIAKGVVTAELEGTQRSLSRRSKLYGSELIATGGDGKAQLKFVDGSIIVLKPDSELLIESFEYTEGASGKSIFSLLKGGFRAVSGAIGKNTADDYQMKTPIATIGVRGTTYEAYLGARLVVGVWNGAIEVSNSAGSIGLGYQNAFSYAEVQGGDVAPKGLIQPPQELLKTQASVAVHEKKQDQKVKEKKAPVQNEPQNKKPQGDKPKQPVQGGPAQDENKTALAQEHGEKVQPSNENPGQNPDPSKAERPLGDQPQQINQPRDRRPQVMNPVAGVVKPPLSLDFQEVAVVDFQPEPVEEVLVVNNDQTVGDCFDCQSLPDDLSVSDTLGDAINNNQDDPSKVGTVDDFVNQDLGLTFGIAVVDSNATFNLIENTEDGAFIKQLVGGKAELIDGTDPVIYDKNMSPFNSNYDSASVEFIARKGSGETEIFSLQQLDAFPDSARWGWWTPDTNGNPEIYDAANNRNISIPAPIFWFTADATPQAVIQQHSGKAIYVNNGVRWGGGSNGALNHMYIDMVVDFDTDKVESGYFMAQNQTGLVRQDWRADVSGELKDSIFSLDLNPSLLEKSNAGNGNVASRSGFEGEVRGFFIEESLDYAGGIFRLYNQALLDDYIVGTFGLIRDFRLTSSELDFHAMQGFWVNDDSDNVLNSMDGNPVGVFAGEVRVNNVTVNGANDIILRTPMVGLNGAVFRADSGMPFQQQTNVIGNQKVDWGYWDGSSVGNIDLHQNPTNANASTPVNGSMVWVAGELTDLSTMEQLSGGDQTAVIYNNLVLLELAPGVLASNASSSITVNFTSGDLSGNMQYDINSDRWDMAFDGKVNGNRIEFDVVNSNYFDSFDNETRAAQTNMEGAFVGESAEGIFGAFKQEVQSSGDRSEGVFVVTQ